MVNKHNDFSTIEDIIQDLPERFERSTDDVEKLKNLKTLVHDLACLLFDKSFTILDKLYDQILEINQKKITK